MNLGNQYIIRHLIQIEYKNDINVKTNKRQLHGCIYIMSFSHTHF